ncbi:hypothetical protein BH11MYX4_BH11MYX4_06080 [soil metagenome]
MTNHPGLHRSLLAIAVAVPMLVMGCTAPADEDASGSEAAFTARTYEAGAKLRVTATSLNLRARGSASATILAVLERGDIVTVVASSGQTGWVNVASEQGKEGWASGTYLTAEDAGNVPGTETNAAVDGDTCAPERATNIVGRFQKALHDTIAFAEGTRDFSKDGYNVLFSFQLTSSCARHPNRCLKFGSSCSTAAGRYQFLTGTWNSIANVRGYATFEPENQERGAAYLIASVRKATIPQDRALTAAEFTNVITKLSFEWASLPPGQYGQPMKSMSQLRTTYCSLAGC